MFSRARAPFRESEQELTLHLLGAAWAAADLDVAGIWQADVSVAHFQDHAGPPLQLFLSCCSSQLCRVVIHSVLLSSSRPVGPPKQAVLEDVLGATAPLRHVYLGHLSTHCDFQVVLNPLLKLAVEPQAVRGEVAHILHGIHVGHDGLAVVVADHAVDLVGSASPRHGKHAIR